MNKNYINALLILILFNSIELLSGPKKAPKNLVQESYSSDDNSSGSKVPNLSDSLTDSDDDTPFLTALMKNKAKLKKKNIEKTRDSGTQTDHTGPIAELESFFSPGVKKNLIDMINSERKSISIMMYRFTEYSVAKAVAARKKLDNLDINVIVNNDFDTDSCEGLKLLAAAGVVLRCNTAVYKPSPFWQSKNRTPNFTTMHHKIFIFGDNNYQKDPYNTHDNTWVWTGSFNATGQAETANWENGIMIRNTPATQMFINEFNTLKNDTYSRPITATECVYKNEATKPKHNLTKEMSSIPHNTTIQSDITQYKK